MSFPIRQGKAGKLHPLPFTILGEWEEEMLKKKDKGMLEHFLPALVVIVLMSVLWVASMVQASNLDRSAQLQQVARKYMLRMETDGYLTEANKSQLLTELRALDMSEINLNGTSFSDVGYGNEVYLVIQGKVTLKDVELKGFSSSMMAEREADVGIRKVSIAKN